MYRIPIGPSHRRCDGLTRRDFLRVGGLGALGLPALLAVGSPGGGGGGISPAEASARSVILVYLGGGLSHHDSFDPKPNAPAEVRGKYATIATKTPGVRYGELMPATGRAERPVLAGPFRRARQRPPRDGDQLGALRQVRLGLRRLPGDRRRGRPTNWATTARCRLISRCPGTRRSPGSWARARSWAAVTSRSRPATRTTRISGSRTSAVGDRAVGRTRPPPDASARRSTDWRGRPRPTTSSGRSTSSSAGRSTSWSLPRPAARSTCPAKTPGSATATAGPTLGQGCLLARRLVESGVRFVTVNSGGWDHHAKIFESLDRRLPDLDQALSSLLDDLDGRGLLETTLVVVMGEFGRTPKVNKDAGRDHWGHAASLRLRRGRGRPRPRDREYRRPGELRHRPPDRPGRRRRHDLPGRRVDPTRHLYTPENRPVAILDDGAPVSELLALTPRVPETRCPTEGLRT